MRMVFAELDQQMRGRDVAPAKRVVLDPGQRGHRDASSATHESEPTHRIHPSLESTFHAPDEYRKRDRSQPFCRRARVVSIFGHLPGGETAVNRKPSEAIFDALFRLVDETSAASVCSRTEPEIPPSTMSRWTILRGKGESPSFNASSFDALMSLDEVKAAAVAALRRLPDQDVAAWEGISEKLARVMSPAVGWRLASLIHELSELDLLDSDLSAIEGIIRARRKSAHERSKADKAASRKGKSTA